MAYVKLPADSIAHLTDVEIRMRSAENASHALMEYLTEMKRQHATCPTSGCLLADMLDVVRNVFADAPDSHIGVITTLLFALDEREFDLTNPVSEIHTIFDPEN